jgi:hypothetical protein
MANCHYCIGWESSIFSVDDVSRQVMPDQRKECCRPFIVRGGYGPNLGHELVGR